MQLDLCQRMFQGRVQMPTRQVPRFRRAKLQIQLVEFGGFSELSWFRELDDGFKELDDGFKCWVLFLKSWMSVSS